MKTFVKNIVGFVYENLNFKFSKTYDLFLPIEKVEKRNYFWIKHLTNIFYFCRLEFHSVKNIFSGSTVKNPVIFFTSTHQNPFKTPFQNLNSPLVALNSIFDECRSTNKHQKILCIKKQTKIPRIISAFVPNYRSKLHLEKCFKPHHTDYFTFN